MVRKKSNPVKGIDASDMFSEVEQGMRELDEKSEYFTLLNSLIQSDDNIELKTEIPSPLKAAILKTIADHLRKAGYIKTADTIDNFLNTFFKYMFSKDRQARLEYIQGLKSIKEDLMERREVKNDGSSL